MKLIGYECQLSEDAIRHSSRKLQSAAQNILSSIQKYHDSTCISGHHDVTCSHDVVGENDEKVEVGILQLPCELYQETIDYRSSCTFQMILQENENENENEKNPKHDNTNTNNNNNTGTRTHENENRRGSDICYGMRSKKTACSIEADYFPIATRRIQSVMSLLLKCLNETHYEQQRNNDSKDDNSSNGADDHGDRDRDSRKVYKFQTLRDHLASISFVSSWNANAITNTNTSTSVEEEQADCIVTLNYSEPIYTIHNDNDNDQDHESQSTHFSTSKCQSPSRSRSKFEIRREAEEVCDKCNITSMILRSKKKKEVVGRSPVFVDDVILLTFDNNVHTRSVKGGIRVRLGNRKECEDVNDNDSINDIGNNNDIERLNVCVVPVYYRKPEDAFQVSCVAL